MTDIIKPALALLAGLDVEPAGQCIRVRIGNETRYVMAASVIAADDAIAYVTGLFA